MLVRGLEPVLIGGIVHLLGALLCLLYLPWASLEFTLTPPVLAGVLVMGLVYTVGNALYFQALGVSELSDIDLFLRTSALWTFLGGVLVLGEPAGPRTLLGAFFILASVATLSQQHTLGFRRAQLLALGAALAFGLGNVLDKGLSPYFDALSYTALNLLLTGLGMLALARPSFSSLADRRLWGPTAWLVALTFALTQLLIILAFQAGGGAGQVILVAQVRLVLLVAAGIFLLGERERLGRKALATVLMLGGIYLLMAAA